MKKTSLGFTLIELMITVAIIAILASIALPSYSQYIQKSRRIEAQASLLDLSHALERYYTQNNSYTGATLPYNRSPQTGTKYYDLTVVVGANTYTITATPTGSQSADSCGNMTINQLGQKTPASNCWN